MQRSSRSLAGLHLVFRLSSGPGGREAGRTQHQALLSWSQPVLESSCPLRHHRPEKCFLSTNTTTTTTTKEFDVEEWNGQTRKFLQDTQREGFRQTLLQNLSQTQKTTNDAIYPTIESLLDSLVRLIEHSHDYGNLYKQPSTSSFSASPSYFYNNLDSALAWELLDYTLEQDLQSKDDGDRWTTGTTQNTSRQCLNIVLQVWRTQYAANIYQKNNNKVNNNKDTNNLLTPSQVLAKLDDYRSSTSTTMISPPDVRSYNILMEAASSSASTSSTTRSNNSSSHHLRFCTKLWDWMWEESSNDPLVRPDVVTLRTYLKAWVKSNHPDAAEHCEDLVDEWMERTAVPTATVDSTTSATTTTSPSSSGIRKSLIHVWALKDPEQAEAYLKDMIHRGGISSDFQEQDEDDLPDTIAWNRVISSYAITHGRPKDAARLLQEFWEYSKKDNNSVRPDLFSYNSVLEGWARLGNATEANRTFQELQHITKIYPNIVSYTSAIKANVAVNDIQMVEQLANECLRACDKEQQQQKLLQRQQRQKATYHSNPSSSAEGEFGEEFMPEGQQQSQQQQQQNLVLDTAFFNIWLRAYCHDMNDSFNFVDQALAVLKHMKQRQVLPDTVTYLSLFQCFLDADENHRAQDWLLEHAKEIDNSSLVSFVSRLVTWNSSKGIDSMPLLQELYEKDYFKDVKSWDRLLSQLLANQGKAVLEWMKSPTTKSYSLVLRALAKDSKGQEAESLFRKWQDGQQYQHEQQNDDSDDMEDSLLVDMYTSVIVGWSKSGNSERSLSWYGEWASANNSSTAVLPPPTQTVQTAVLSALARERDAQGAEDFLQRLVEDYRRGLIDAPPDVVMYNIVLSAWAKAKGNNGKRAEKLLNAMPEKDTISYNTTIHAYARMGKMKRAEQLASDLVELFRTTNNDSCRPDLTTFRSLLSGYVRSKDPKAPERAMRVLNWMRTLYKEGILGEGPDMQCYHMALDILAKSNENNNAANYASAILRCLVEESSASVAADNIGTPVLVDSITIEKVLGVYGDVPARAEALLNEICNAFVEGSDNVAMPSENSFRIVLESLVKKGMFENAATLIQRMRKLYMSGKLNAAKPTREAYILILKACARSGLERAGDAAEEVFRAMQSHYLEDNDKSVQPRGEGYKWLLIALSKTKPAEYVERNFHEALGSYLERKDRLLQPDIACINAVLTACRKSNEVDRARTFLSLLEDLNDKKILSTKPTLISYNLALACMSSQGMAEDSEEMLRHMENRGLSPDTVTYNTILNAWANSRLSMAVSRVGSLIHEMKAPADSTTYSTWLKAVALSNDSNKGEIAKNVLANMKLAGFEPTSRDMEQLQYAMAAGGGD